MYLFFDTETTGLPKNWKAPVTDLMDISGLNFPNYISSFSIQAMKKHIMKRILLHEEHLKSVDSHLKHDLIKL